MVTTIFYDSYDKEEEDYTEEEGEEEGEDTECDDPEPEYGNPDLKFMKNRVQQYPRITREEDTYDKLMMKYDFRCYGCKSKNCQRRQRAIHLSMVYRVGNDTIPNHPRMFELWRSWSRRI
jgi:hypothetical protein